ncbi:MAG: HXXEE domain-containing protein [Paracoccaceae bacterium]
MGWRLAILGTAFALHNLEEVLRFDAWQDIGLAGPSVDQATFAVAVIMLTVTVAAALAAAVRERMNGVSGWIAVIIAAGLLVNAAGHAVQSIVALTPVPGVYTGLLLVLPAAAWVLAGLDATPGRAWRKRVLALLLGGAAMPVVALAALQLAEMLLSWVG